MKKTFIFVLLIIFIFSFYKTEAQTSYDFDNTEGTEEPSILPPLEGGELESEVGIEPPNEQNTSGSMPQGSSSNNQESNPSPSGGNNQNNTNSRSQTNSTTVVPNSSNQSNGGLNYTPLTDIGTVANNLAPGFFNSNTSGLGVLLNQIFFVVLAIAVVLAVFAIIRGGYLYMTSTDKAFQKEIAKRKIQAAFGGLILAFGTILILNTINTGIANFTFTMGPLQAPQPQGVWDTANKEVQKLQEGGIENGLEAYQAFDKGNLYHQLKLAYLKPEEWKEILEKSNPEESRQFILQILQEKKFNGEITDERDSVFLNTLNDIKSVAPELVQEATDLLNARQNVGFYYKKDYGRGTYSIVYNKTEKPVNFESFSQQLSSHIKIFELQDTKTIKSLYESSGGKIENNPYSSAVIETLNKTENTPNVSYIKNWVDKNGNSIGIKKTGDTYTLSN